MKNEINIIEEFAEKGFENSLIVTFNCSLFFYEGLILKQLLNNGCSNNVILMDHRQYDDMIAVENKKVQYCGSYYICERMKVNGAFHSKIILLTGKDSGKLLIGSGNSTISGYGRNFELFYKFEYSSEKGQYLQLFKEVVSYIEELHKKFKLSNNPAFSIRLKSLKDSTPWLGKKSEPTEEKFIHNINTPILDQIFDAAPKDIKEIVVAAPFFEDKLETIKTYRQKYPHSKITVLTQSKNTNFPIEYYLDNQKLFPGVSLHKISSIVTGDRSFHSKFIYMTNGKSQLFFSGSPNQTGVALSESGKQGNSESGMLLTDRNKRSIFEPIWKNLVDGKKVSVPQELLRREFPEQLPSNKNLSIKIIDAYIHNLQLKVSYESRVAEIGELILNGEPIKKIKLDKNGELLMDLNRKNDNCNIIQIKTKNSESNLLWISNTFIKKVDAKNPITRQVNSLSRYIIDQSFIQWLVELSPNLISRDNVTQDIMQGMSLTDQEEAGERKKLREELFFIDEKPDYYSLLQRIDNPAAYTYGNDLFTDVLNSILHSIGRSTPAERFGTEGTVRHAKDTPPDNGEEVGGKTIPEKVARKIDHLISGVIKKIDQPISLDFSTTAELSQFLAALVWFLDGIKLRIEEDEEYTISINKWRYLEASIAALTRLWVKTSPMDYLEGKKEETDYQLLSLTNVYILSICLVAFNMRTLMDSGKSVEEIKKLQEKLLDIFNGILLSIRKIPKTYLEKIISKEQISRVTKKLECFTRSYDINLDKIWGIKFDRLKFEKDLILINNIYFKKLLTKKKYELNRLERELITAKNNYIKIKNLMTKEHGHYLEYQLAEDKIEKLNEEYNSVEKLVDNLSVALKPLSNKLMCQKAILDFFFDLKLD